MRTTLLPIYLKVLIEEESPIIDTPGSIPRAPSEHPRDFPKPSAGFWITVALVAVLAG